MRVRASIVNRLLSVIINNRNTKFALVLLLFNSTAYADYKPINIQPFDLMLVGGGLKTCSSMSLRNCSKRNFDQGAKAQTLYEINPSAVKKLRDYLAETEFDDLKSLKINQALLDIYANKADQKLSKAGLRNAFDEINELELYKNLPDHYYYALLDFLESPQVDKSGVRVKETTSLTSTKDAASIDIYRTFVDQAAQRKPAAQEKPIILVVTASSRDPFEVADFYVSIFRQAGGDVFWLPLDKTLQQARQFSQLGFDGCTKLAQLRANNLSYDRDKIYPERVALQQSFCRQSNSMLKKIQSAQGIFFNGGDQSLTIAALKFSDGTDSPELALIRDRMQSGHLIVGGTSAGTAVQAGGVFADRPIPMMTNGDSRRAMQRGAFANPPPSQRCNEKTNCGQGTKSGDLTYLASGGSGLFRLGLVDTHFSERDRETRLAVFLADVNQYFGFGVDETTALLVKAKGKQFDLQVIGSNGVMIMDRRGAHYNKVNVNEQIGLQNRDISGFAHYLAHGSRASYNLDSQQWQFSLPGEKLTERKRIKRDEQGNWRNQLRDYCGTQEPIAWLQFSNRYLLKANKDTVFSYDSDANQCHYVNLPFVIATN